MTQPTRCTTTGKLAYLSPQAAYAAQSKAVGRAKRRYRRQNYIADKAYKCPECSLWHVTHNPTNLPRERR